jgi:ribokinase
MSPRVVVLGSLNMDFVVRVVALPAPGETTLGSDFQMIPGGKGANQACAVGRLGARLVGCAMAGRVGYDLFADHLRASLSAAGVDVSGVHSAKSHPTGVALIWVDQQGQNSIVVAPGANAAVDSAAIAGYRSLLEGSRYALFQLETPIQAVAEALALSREMGVRTILDPAPAQPLSSALLGNVDILTPNESEARQILGRPAGRVDAGEYRQVAGALRKLGVRAVVLKLGDRGAFYFDGDSEFHQPAFAVEAVDSTAAGDIFNGGLAVALAEGKECQDALGFAAAAAAISVTRVGAQSSVPSRSEVDDFLRSRAS